MGGQEVVSRIIMAASAAMVLSVPASARDASEVPPALAQEIDKSLGPQQGRDRPGFILRVSRSGKTLYEFRSGAADLEQDRAITANTVFHIASLSKQITGAALAHAIREGRLRLDDPVAKWVPETRKYGKALTIAHLVYMTSGLTEYTDVKRPADLPWNTFYYFTTDDAIAASLSVDHLQFQPGAKWQYANINYMLLARIVSKAYGKPFGTVVREKIFTPLGMTASLINDDITTVIPNRANAYTDRTPALLFELRTVGHIAAREADGLVQIRRNAPHYGGSGVMTSMADWTRWQTELASHAVFGEEFWKLMLSTRKFDHDKVNDAFGLVHGEHRGRPTVWYSGKDIDASTYSVTFTDTGTGIACFSNNPLEDCEGKVFGAADILMANGAL